MKRNNFTQVLLLSFIALLFCQPAALAQLTAQIGTGTQAPLTNNSIYSPICRFSATTTNDCSRSNLLYTAAELTTAGITNGATINKISFFKIGTGASVAGFTFAIHMRNSTTAPPLVNTPWATLLTTHTEVYSTTTQTIPATTGWVEFTLTTPFVYTGGSLEIAMTHDMTMVTGNPTTGPFDWQYTNGFQDYIIGIVGSSLGAIPNLSGTVTNYKLRPNILFNYSTGSTSTSLTGTSTVCVGATTTLVGSPTGGTYSSATPTVATVNSTTGVVTGVAAGTSVITYTGGTGTATLTVTVSAPPVVPAITGNLNLCTGATSLLSNTLAGGTWSSSNTSIATVSSTGTVTGVAAGTATITYTVGTGGCSASNTATVTVSSPPVVPAITGTANLCAGATTVLSNTLAGGSWTSSNTTVATVSSTGTVSGLSAGTSTITYSVTNAAGCTATATLLVTVTILPVVPAITGNNTICAGSTSNLSNTTAGGVWESSNTTVATVNATGTVAGLTAGTATISYTVTNAGGCSATADMLVTVNPIPTVAAITGTASACVGTTSTLSHVNTGGTWASSNTQIATVSAAGVVSAVAAGTATISYTVLSAGCTGSATVPFVVNTRPNPPIIQNGTLLSTSNFASYSWSLNNNPIPGANAQTYLATSNGIYTVTVTDANGCTGTSGPLNVSVVSVGNTILDNDISIFPNPSEGVVQLKSDIPVDVTVSTLDGRVLKSFSQTKVIDISNLADGIYLLKIMDKNKELLRVEKIVKSNR